MNRRTIDKVNAALDRWIKKHSAPVTHDHGTVSRRCQIARRSFDAMQTLADNALKAALKCAADRDFAGHNTFMEVYREILRELRARSPYMARRDYMSSLYDGARRDADPLRERA